MIFLLWKKSWLVEISVESVQYIGGREVGIIVKVDRIPTLWEQIGILLTFVSALRANNHALKGFCNNLDTVFYLFTSAWLSSCYRFAFF